MRSIPILCLLFFAAVMVTADDMTQHLTIANPHGHPPYPCYLPKVVGKCKAAFKRYYYNVKTKKCELFIYGGCGGNANNFHTIADCYKACPKPKPTHPKPGPIACPAIHCFVHPCSTAKCPAFPHAECRTRCPCGTPEFYVNGRKVKCDKKPHPYPSKSPYPRPSKSPYPLPYPPKYCKEEGEKCRILTKYPLGTVSYLPVHHPPSQKSNCCPRLKCCVCGPPVVHQHHYHPHKKEGVCAYRCICPRG